MTNNIDNIDKEAGLIGFFCPKSKRGVKFEFCWSVCKEHCAPLPVLLALSHQNRPNEPWIYHVTEVFNPPQQVWLQRHMPYYVEPDSIIDMNIGTAWHEKLEEMKKYVQELRLQDDYIMEKNHQEVISIKAFQDPMEDITVILSGTPDLYVESTKTIWDYKVVKYFYTLKYMLEGKWADNAYMWQLNTYRTLFYPEAEQMKLYCYVKDWKYNFPERHGVNHTEIVKVPAIDPDAIHQRIVDSLKEHVRAELTGEYRECAEDETWDNRLRCKYYCGVSKICPQNQKYLKEKK